MPLPGTSTSLSNATLNINGSLTISGAPLQLQLDTATIAVSGDLRIQDGMILTVRLVLFAIIRQMICLFFEGVLNVSLSSSWSPSSSPIKVADDFLLDLTSILAITLSTNPYSGVAPIAVGRSSSLQGYFIHLYPITRGDFAVIPGLILSCLGK